MHYHYECEEYCEQCAPPNSYEDDGEQDCPANCCVCHRPLDYRLTSSGVEYVLEAIRDSLREGKEKRNVVHNHFDGSYYEGSRACEVVHDWATDLRDYCLSPRQRRLVDLYLHLSQED